MGSRFKKVKNDSMLTSTLATKKDLQNVKANFRVSLQYLDATQAYGSGFKDWQREGLLSKALEVLQGYCCRPLIDQVDGDKFTIYGDFPKTTHTKFVPPKSIAEDANWGRIHVTGSAILAGHIVDDTFYVVFLDKTHKFYLTKSGRPKKDQ